VAPKDHHRGRRDDQMGLGTWVDHARIPCHEQPVAALLNPDADYHMRQAPPLGLCPLVARGINGSN
jgi:hypothetical protein